MPDNLNLPPTLWLPTNQWYVHVAQGVVAHLIRWRDAETLDYEVYAPQSLGVPSVLQELRPRVFGSLVFRAPNYAPWLMRINELPPAAQDNLVLVEPRRQHIAPFIFSRLSLVDVTIDRPIATPANTAYSLYPNGRPIVDAEYVPEHISDEQYSNLLARGAVVTGLTDVEIPE